MYKSRSCLVLLLFFYSITLFAMKEKMECEGTKDEGSFSQWYQQCMRLPKLGDTSKGFIVTPLKKNELETTAKKYVALQKKQFRNCLSWVGKAKTDPEQMAGCKPLFFDINKDQKTITPHRFLFSPYVQRLLLPSDAEVAMIGDLHGGIEPLMRTLDALTKEGYFDKNNRYKISREKNAYIFFLGDYIDRGPHGCEVAKSVLKLVTKNPDRCFAIRGNHEDPDTYGRYTFLSELLGKFISKFGRDSIGSIESTLSAINEAFECMPVAIYAGVQQKDGKVQYFLASHGGFDFGYNPNELLADGNQKKYQLVGKLYQKTFANRMKEGDKGLYETCFASEEEMFPEGNRCVGANAMQKTKIPIEGLHEDRASLTPTEFVLREPFTFASLFGFMWSDFDPETRSSALYSANRGYVYGQLFTEYMFTVWKGNKHTVSLIVRGHQHNSRTDTDTGRLADPMMRRIYNLDNESRKEDTGAGFIWEPKRADDSLPQNTVITLGVAPGVGYGEQVDKAGFFVGIIKFNSICNNWSFKVFPIKDTAKN